MDGPIKSGARFIMKEIVEWGVVFKIKWASIHSWCDRLQTSPTGSLLSAQEELGISYTWRSIIRCFKALNKGLIWRVGDGSNIKIWDNPWIANGVTRWPITPKGLILLSRVDPGTDTWDKQLVRDAFLGGRRATYPGHTHEPRT